MLKIKKILLENFMSHGGVPMIYNLDEHNLTLVVGPNGAGKSSAFLDALFFGFYGKTIRGVKKDLLSNTAIPGAISLDKMIVEVWFDIDADEYHLIRTGKELSIEQNGIKWPVVNQKDLEKRFLARLNISKNVFSQLILIGGKHESLITMKPELRRKIVEELLDITVLGDMKVMVNTKMKELSEPIIQQKTLVNTLHASAVSLKKFYLTTMSSADKEVVKKNGRIDELELEIAEYVANNEYLEGDIVKLNESILGWEQQEELYTETLTLITQQQMIIHDHESDLGFLEDNNVCPSCHQTIEAKFKEENINRLNGEHDHAVKGLNKLVSLSGKYNKHVEYIEGQKSLIRESKSKIQQNNALIKQTRKTINGIKKDIETFQTTDNTPVVEKVAEYDAAKVVLDELQRVYNNYVYISKMLGDEGVKKQIISTYLPRLNFKIDEYMKRFLSGLLIELSDTFDLVVFTPGKTNYVFNSFSAGEQLRMNMAIMFAWRDIAKERGSVDCNYIVMDELFDGSLDFKGMESMMELLVDLSKENNLYVISHRDDLKKLFKPFKIISMDMNGYTEVKKS